MNTPTPETPKLTRKQEDIERARETLAKAELFVLKYDSKLPDDLGWFTAFGPWYQVDLTSRSDDDRNKALTLLGEVFGRSGWTAKLNVSFSMSDKAFFDWSKEVDGVRVKIEGAQPTGQPQSFPVDPKQFPLQIEDAS